MTHVPNNKLKPWEVECPLSSPLFLFPLEDQNVLGQYQCWTLTLAQLTIKPVQTVLPKHERTWVKQA